MGLGVLLLCLAFAARWLARPPPTLPGMTLAEALWVCSPDLKTYYPPGSPESLQMVEVLSKTMLSEGLPSMRTSCFLCAVREGSDNARAQRPVAFDFDPRWLPTNAVIVGMVTNLGAQTK